MKSQGIVSLATVLVIALFLFSVGVLLGIQSGTSIFTGFSEKNAEFAQALAEAGVQDAIIRIARDSTYSGSYRITQASDEYVDVTVVTGTPYRVSATSTFAKPLGTIQRSIQALVTVDADGTITNITKTNL